ncbi:hypothetical protein BDV26DRAFT_127920 [Aspergillus bertholletiae]|uniref:Uncharacterized protein n=1 Tax=Aspergillus bertholletiae TaxID=1226010 RepID=A0A5N7BFX0_9EURO|nr:hypothetical protein BDV26DRAFT_127920 [Aspergillus bertholletiae]
MRQAAMDFFLSHFFLLLHHHHEEGSCKPEDIVAISQVKSAYGLLGAYGFVLTAVIGALTLHHTSTIICSGQARASSWLTCSAKRIDANKGYISLALFSVSLLVLILYGTVQSTIPGLQDCSSCWTISAAISDQGGGMVYCCIQSSMHSSRIPCMTRRFRDWIKQGLGLKTRPVGVRLILSPDKQTGEFDESFHDSKEAAMGDVSKARTNQETSANAFQWF